MFIMLNNGKIPSNNELSEMTGISLDRIKQARECMRLAANSMPRALLETEPAYE